MVSPRRCGGGGALHCLGLRTTIILMLAQWVLAQGDAAAPADDCTTWMTTNPEVFTIINSQEDIKKQLSCPIINRSIMVSASEPLEDATVLNFTGIQRFNKRLTIGRNKHLVEIRADDLTDIGEGLVLYDLPSLATINFPKLKGVAHLQLKNLPSLKELPDAWKGGGVVVMPLANMMGWDIIEISVTNLQSIDHFRIDNAIESTEDVVIDNNIRLTNLNISGAVEIPGAISVQGNNAGLSINLPNLSKVGNLSVSLAGGLSVPLLSRASDTLSIFRTDIVELSLPALIYVGQNIYIDDNYELQDIAIPLLTDVGGYRPPDLEPVGFVSIEQNEKLTSLRFPYGLEVWKGMQLRGEFATIYFQNADVPLMPETFLRIASSDSSLDCSSIRKAAEKKWSSKNQPLDNVFRCEIADQATGTNSISGTPSSETIDATATPISTDAPLGSSLTKEITGVLAGACTIGALLAMAIFLRYMGSRKARRLDLERMAERARNGDPNADVEWIVMADGERVARRRSRDRGVVRRSEDNEVDGERPPVYERVGKPGQIPPTYLEVINSHTSDDTAVSSEIGDRSEGRARTGTGTGTGAEAASEGTTVITSPPAQVVTPSADAVETPVDGASTTNVPPTTSGAENDTPAPTAPRRTDD